MERMGEKPMFYTNEAIKILLENATTLSERNEITTLTEQESVKVNNAMVTNLYKSAIEKAHVDFEDIPNSAGNITRYSGYKSLMETIELLKSLAAKGGTKIPELDTVEQAISNIIAGREIFEKGFVFEKDFIILQYNTLVFAVVEAVSIIISSYVDFVKRPDRVEFVILKSKDRSGSLAIKNLEKFNAVFKSGEFSKVNNAVIQSGRENLVGSVTATTITTPILVVAGALAIVPIIRELIFLYYYSRMRLSDFLEQQAALLEINKTNVQASTLPAAKKNQVLKKQDETIKKLQQLSDKVKVNRATSEQSTVKEIKKENTKWTINEVKTQAASTDTTGFQLL